MHEIVLFLLERKRFETKLAIDGVSSGTCHELRTEIVLLCESECFWFISWINLVQKWVR